MSSERTVEVNLPFFKKDEIDLAQTTFDHIRGEIEAGRMTEEQAVMKAIGRHAEMNAKPQGFTPLDMAMQEVIEQGIRTPKDGFRNAYLTNMSTEALLAENAAREIRDRQLKKDRHVSPAKEHYGKDVVESDINRVSKAVGERGLVLERVQCSRLHHAIDELARRGSTHWDTPEFRKSVIDFYQPIVVQHDWAAAFKGAEGFADGEVRLPYEHCAFEFRITGFHTIVLLGHEKGDGIYTGALITSVDDRWYAPTIGLTFDGVRLLDPRQQFETTFGEDLLDILGQQIRAICIMLDAQVAEVDVVRVSEKLQRNRIKAGRVPMKDYHVVNLAKRHRVRPALPDPNRELRASPRLHWRRGHWRHFAVDRKTWIEWMLVGDPDLGFVDKEYRL